LILMQSPNGVIGARRRVSAVPKTKTFLIEVPNDQALPASEDIAVLSDRISMLEALLAQHGVEVPPFVGTVPEAITVPVVGYCQSDGRGGRPCPLSVTIEAEAAFDVWRATVYPEATDEDRAAWEAHLQRCFETGTAPGPSPLQEDGTVYRPSHAAALKLHQDLLVAAMPGLSPEVASVLAGDGGDWEVILADLGWWVTVQPAAVADPNATGEETTDSPSTGDASSPTSPSPSPASTS
jgi:hypothetical protein